uniref:ELL associated factor 1 n=1 Tax=Gallus gallus TaxID=9031 RepID=A0A8V0Z5H0_CHICK
ERSSGAQLKEKKKKKKKKKKETLHLDILPSAIRTEPRKHKHEPQIRAKQTKSCQNLVRPHSSRTAQPSSTSPVRSAHTRAALPGSAQAARGAEAAAPEARCPRAPRCPALPRAESAGDPPPAPLPLPGARSPARPRAPRSAPAAAAGPGALSRLHSAPGRARGGSAHGGRRRGRDRPGRDRRVRGHERLGEPAAGQGGPPAAAGRELRAAAQGLLPHHPLAEGSSKIQARIEQQSARASQPPPQFRAPTKPATGPKTSPLKDNPSPEPQLDDIKRELRAEVEIIEQMSSSSGSSSSNSESSSGSEDESSSSEGEELAHVSPSQPPHQQYNNRNAVANGTSRPQGSNQLMNTLRNDLQLSESGSDSDD